MRVERERETMGPMSWLNDNDNDNESDARSQLAELWLWKYNAFH